MRREKARTTYRAEREDWDRNASFYRRDERSPLMRVLAEQRETLYAIRRGQRALDVGCGTGATVARMIARGVDAYGIDFSPAMIEAAVVEHGLDARVTCADADNIPYENASFDVVIADGVLHHLAVQGRLRDALREMRRVLRPGGKLCCFDRNGSAASYLLLKTCLAVKECLRRVSGGAYYASSATRNEIPFGGRDDMEILRRCGFKLHRRRNVSSAPFFLAVVAANTIQYFLSERLRGRIEPHIARLVKWIDAHCDWHWLCVEQLAVFQCEAHLCGEVQVARDAAWGPGPSLGVSLVPS